MARRSDGKGATLPSPSGSRANLRAPARDPLARWDVGPPRPGVVGPPGVIKQMLDDRHELSSPITKNIMGPLAALLVAKWAGYDEAEREAIAAFDGCAFRPELPEALSRPAWERASEGHVVALVEALKSMTGRHGRAAPFTQGLVDVAPIVISAAGPRSFLASLLQWVREVDMDTPASRRAAAGSFDETLRAVAGRDGAEIDGCTTPGPVADLMVELAGPVPGERVYDPCFGFGGLLVGAARRVHEAVGTDSGAAWSHVQRTGIFGVEIDRVSYAIGLCRTLLAGIEQPGLAFGDALDRALPDSRSRDGFDCILSAPPWGHKAAHGYAGRDASSSRDAENPTDRGVSRGPFTVPSRNAENLFLQHVMGNLRPGGRAVVAVPEPTLYRSGSDQRVREALLSSYRVDAVVSLPPGAFAPHTGVAGSLLCFRCDEPHRTVRFVEISPPAWDRALVAGDEDRGWGDLPRRLAALVKRRELIDGTVPQDVEAWDVPVEDLAARDYELVAKRTGSQALQAELERIVAADPSLKVERLDAVAEVRRGLTYERRLTTTTRPAQGGGTGLLRVGDIKDTGIRKPSLFLQGGNNTRPTKDDVLRAGDIVVTTSGMVGKIGLISDGGGAVGSLATSNMVVVRARGALTPHYVAAMFRSPTYQDWLSGHASGATIRHLSIRILRRVPIPVPPVPVQDVVIRELDGTRGDALAALTRQLTATAPSPLAVWLEAPFVARLAAGRASGESDRIGALSDAADALLSLARSARGSELASTEAGDRRTLAWLDAAHQAAAALGGVASIPRGAGRLAVIEAARSRLNEAQHALDAATGPTVNRLRSFTRELVGLAEDEVRAMQESVGVGIAVEPAEVVVGIDSEVRLRLTNSSAVPLRDLAVETRPAVGAARIAYLAEGATHDVPLAVRTHDATRPLRLVVSWRAHRLDGTPVRNEEEIELHVRSTREAVRAGDLGASPYIVGNPVDRQEMFFGRSEVIERIKRQVESSTHANVVLLEGNRRTGKTSILRQLAKADVLPEWIPVDCSLQDAEGDGGKPGISTRNLYRLLARRTGWTLYNAGVETWFPQLPERASNRPFKVAFRHALDEVFADEQPFETFAVYIAAAVQAASPRRILLMLDEFDKLQEGIDAGVTSPQAPENIRHLLQHQAGLSAIITGSRRLKRLREEYWSALFGLGCRIPVSALPDDDAKRLVTDPVAERLDYLPRARDRVVELTSRHPFLVQSLCNQVFEQAAETGRRTVTTEVVEEAATALVRDNEHFRTLWGYAGNERRRLLLALCDKLAQEPDPVNFDLLELKLDRLGVQVRSGRVLSDDLAALRELELVEYADSPRGDNYRLAVPLMARWLQHNVDFKDIVRRAQQEAMER